MGNVAQLVTIKNFGSPFFLNKKSAETPIFIVFFEKQPFQKNKRGKNTPPPKRVGFTICDAQCTLLNGLLL